MWKLATVPSCPVVAVRGIDGEKGFATGVCCGGEGPARQELCACHASAVHSASKSWQVGWTAPRHLPSLVLRQVTAAASQASCLRSAKKERNDCLPLLRALGQLQRQLAKWFSRRAPFFTALLWRFHHKTFGPFASKGKKTPAEALEAAVAFKGQQRQSQNQKKEHRPKVVGH